MHALTETPLRHGYSMTDLDSMARTAVAVAFARVMDYSDRYDAAWHAIAETLCAAEQAPTRKELLDSGLRGIHEIAQDYYHTWGMARRDGIGAEGSMAGYQRYWELTRRAAVSPEDMVVDRAAVRQIWPQLSDTQQRVLMALAVHGDPDGAAAAVGKNVVTYRSHLSSARRTFFALWHEHETPSRLWSRASVDGRRTATQGLRNRRMQRARLARATAAV